MFSAKIEPDLSLNKLIVRVEPYHTTFTKTLKNTCEGSIWDPLKRAWLVDPDYKEDIEELLDAFSIPTEDLCNG